MTDKEYKKLLRRRWLERLLYKRLWFTKKQSVRIAKLFY